MNNNTVKNIQDVTIGDETKDGNVTGLHVFPLEESNIYNYHGVIVSGDHKIYENGLWKHVKNSDKAKKYFGNIPDNNGLLYNFDTTNHRIFIDGKPNLIFADYIEIDDDDNIIDNMELKILNNKF